MSANKIKEHNASSFLKDLKRVSAVVVFVPSTGIFVQVTKKEVRKAAEAEIIQYYVTDEIYAVKRDVMVIF